MRSSGKIRAARMCLLFVAAAVLLVAGCDRATPTQPSAKAPVTKRASDDSAAHQPAGVEQAATHPPGKLDPPEVAAKSEDRDVAAAPAVLAPPPLFDGWPKPQVALLITGQQMGYIEPCGCTGLENQKGGLARRHTLVKQLAEERGWPLVAVDAGSQVRRFGKQAELKFDHTAKALRTMNYAAVALGADDLHLPPGDILAFTNPDDKPSIFVGANVALLDRTLQPTFTVAQAGGKKVGITSVLGEKHEQRLRGDELVHEPPLAALKRVAETLQAQQCDFYVLLAHAPLEEAQKLAREVPIFNLVVAATDLNLPSRELEPVEGTQAKLVQVGTKAMYAGVVGLFDDAQQPLRYESVPLDAKLADSPQMLAYLTEYQEQLQQLGLEGLGLRPQPHPSGRKFVGSETCGECHTKAFEKWSSTPHAHATESLVHPPNSRGEIARHFDPECLSCHVTGWEPQKFYPFASGYLSLEKTPKLVSNGCENCHGPGSAHVAAETGDEQVSADEQAKRRDAMKLPLAGGAAERKCLECHDIDNSPDFHHEGAFAKYWKEVEHRGKD